MSAGLTVLGEAPPTLSAPAERLFLWVERWPGAGMFRPAPWFGMRCAVNTGGNDAIPTAEISLSLARNPETHPDFPYTSELRDWQVLDYNNAPLNVWLWLLGGRRVQSRTARASAQEDWVLFEGYVDKLELGWSGAGRELQRWAQVIATSTIVAADREQSQFMVGQWRRSRRAVIGLAGGEEHDDWEHRHETVCVTALPCIFNSRGLANCAPDPLELNDGARVYVFTDPTNPRAEHWTVARMLRYVQWAALQSALPIGEHAPDEERYGRLDGLSLPWTSCDLRFGNLDDLVGPYLSEDDYDEERTTPARDRAMRLALADVAVQAMSVLEAFVYLVDRAGMLCRVEHEVAKDAGADVLTLLYFGIRGDRVDVDWSAREGRGAGQIGGASSGGIEPPGEDPDPGTHNPTTSRGVYLWVPSDRGDSGSQTPAEIFASASATEGSLLIDESQVRPGVFVLGAATQFEIAAELKPGWQANDWWDVDVDDPDAVAAAQARIGRPEFQERHVRSAMTPSYFVSMRNVGRFWVWNEDGAYDAIRYQRAAGPWSTAAAWDPPRFSTDIGYKGLTERGDDGWSLRPRRFLPTRAEARSSTLLPPVPLGLLLQLSFDSGANWRFFPMNVTIEGDRCAIYFGQDDLNEVRDEVTQLTFIQAYMAGVLRVRVLANVEGDDGLVGFAPPSGESPVNRDWWELLDRGRQLRRQLRFDGPTPTGGPIANSPLCKPESEPDGWNCLLPNNLDPLGEADNIAARFQRDLELRRLTGQCTIPWLWRDEHGPRIGYRIGDEILGLQTGDQDTFLNMEGHYSLRWPASRIIGITYNYADEPDEQSTTLRIEDRVYSPEDEIGDPSVDQGAPSGLTGLEGAE